MRTYHVRAILPSDLDGKAKLMKIEVEADFVEVGQAGALIFKNEPKPGEIVVSQGNAVPHTILPPGSWLSVEQKVVS